MKLKTKRVGGIFLTGLMALSLLQPIEPVSASTPAEGTILHEDALKYYTSSKETFNGNLLTSPENLGSDFFVSDNRIYTWRGISGLTGSTTTPENVGYFPEG